MIIVKIILFIIATILLLQAITEDDSGKGFANLFLSLFAYIVAFGLEMV